MATIPCGDQGWDGFKVKLEIKGFIETSLLDWDGKIVSTLYVAGCNFRCPFCHNSGLIEKPHEYKTITLEHIEKFLLEHKEFLDGICLTGGEPTIHKNRGLSSFLRKIKDNGFLVKFDSNGTDPECLEALVTEKLVDYIAMDVKGPLDERYDRLSGIKSDLSKIKKSIKLIMECKVDYEFRTTVVPTLLELDDIQYIAKALAGSQKFVLQQFVPLHVWDQELLKEVKPYSREQLEAAAKASKKFISNTLVRGA